MSTFRRHMEVVLDGDSFKVTTTYKDNLRAEEAIGREKLELAQSPMHIQARVAFYAFGRCYPDHPLARNWAGFIDVFDDVNDLETGDEAANVLDPTLPAE